MTYDDPGDGAASDNTPSYYALLQVRPDASIDAIAAAYQRQLERYDPARAAGFDAEFVAVVDDRRSALAEAVRVLSDPTRRFAYDRALGLVGDAQADRQGISNREVLAVIGGILLALLILATIWSVLGRQPADGPAVSEVNYPALPITLRTLDGQRFDLAEQRGKVVLVNFWATWCKPCEAETPDLQAVYERLAAEGLLIVGVNLFNAEQAQGRGEREVRMFAERYGVTYPIALDETGQVARDYRIAPIPVSYFIDADGNARFIRIGQLNRSEVEVLFRRLRPVAAQAK